MTQDEPQDDTQQAADAEPTPMHAETSHALASPGDMLVTLDFHLPGHTVSLAEASAWTEGGLIALPDTGLEADVPITVRNGDRVIAAGRLVRLDDCFGVRIDKTFLRR
jgi:flagellar motor switch/type III secretory pathway protein FliN